MKKSRLIGASCAVVFSFISIPASAATLLAVDFGGNTTQAGFISQGSTNTTYNLAGGMSVFVDASTNPGIFDRNRSSVLPSSGSEVIADGTDINALLDDGIMSLYGEAISITISNVVGTFGFEAWMYDPDLNSQSVSMNVFLSGSGLVATAEAGAGKTLLPTAFSYSTSGENVVITVQDNNSYNQPRFNGFAITGLSAVPVPAAVWLFGSGLLGLIGVARRKKAA